MKLKIHVLRFSVSTLASLGMYHFCQAVEYRLSPMADTSIYSDGNGAYDNRSDGKSDYVWVSTLQSGVKRRFLMRFDLSGIPPGSQVQSVSLRLYERLSRDTHHVSLHRLNAPWAEAQTNGGGSGAGVVASPGDTTWSHRVFPLQTWAVPGGDFVSIPSAATLMATAPGFYTFTSLQAGSAQMRQDVQDWVNTPTNNQGWIFIGNEVLLQSAKQIASRETADASVRPLLIVQADPPVVSGADGDVPLPAWALVLLGGGLLGLLSRKPRELPKWE